MDDALKLQIDEWQGTIAHSIEQHPVPYLVKVRGLDYVMFPETFNPNYAKASLILLDNLGVRPGDTVLDPFTGSGADAIFAVLAGECGFASSTVAQTRFASDVIMEVYELTRTSRPTSPPAPAVVDVETDRLAQR